MIWDVEREITSFIFAVFPRIPALHSWCIWQRQLGCFPPAALKLYSSLLSPCQGTFVFFLVLLQEIYVINNSLWSVEDLLRHVHVELFSHRSSKSSVFVVPPTITETGSFLLRAVIKVVKGIVGKTASRGWGALEGWRYIYMHSLIN